MPAPRILIYDLESSDLYADHARLFAFAYKWLDEKRTHVISILDFTKPCECCGLMKLDDTEVIKAAHAVMAQADIQITFNGKQFDQKFLTAKFMRLRLPPLPPTSHIDLYQTARVTLRIRPKNLKNLIKFLGMKNKKTDLDWDIWKRAAEGDAKAVRYIVKHGAADVLATEELYLNHLRPYIRQHPRINGYGPCRHCGEDTMQKRGKAVTMLKGLQYRFACQSCGAWETRAA